MAKLVGGSAGFFVRQRGICITNWIAAALLALATWLPVVRADTVDDRDGVFAHVTILDLDDDQLVFVFNDGRTLQRDANAVRSIVLAAGNDPAAEDLSRAELLRVQGKR